MEALGVPAVVRQPLPQEEVELGVIGITAVRDQLGVDEDGLCGFVLSVFYRIRTIQQLVEVRTLESSLNQSGAMDKQLSFH